MSGQAAHVLGHTSVMDAQHTGRAVGAVGARERPAVAEVAGLQPPPSARTAAEQAQGSRPVVDITSVELVVGRGHRRTPLVAATRCPRGWGSG